MCWRSSPSCTVPAPPRTTPTPTVWASQPSALSCRPGWRQARACRTCGRAWWMRCQVCLRTGAWGCCPPCCRPARKKPPYHAPWSPCCKLPHVRWKHHILRVQKKSRSGWGRLQLRCAPASGSWTWLRSCRCRSPTTYACCALQPCCQHLYKQQATRLLRCCRALRSRLWLSRSSPARCVRTTHKAEPRAMSCRRAVRRSWRKRSPRCKPW
mmetsp:Transcript_25518/g.69231  ORF Transcript_25518/g.69231 Transcript_25518/m.69231 type:complete len:211 (-) Transcript_25518:2418-3050(-)